MICESCQIDYLNLITVKNKKDEEIQVCNGCLKESYQQCRSCDEYMHDDKILFYQDLGNKGRNYCEYCADYLSKCTECECDLDTKLDSNYVKVEKEIFCEFCYNDHKCSCHECGYEYNDLEEGYDNRYCSDECETIANGSEL